MEWTCGIYVELAHLGGAALGGVPVHRNNNEIILKLKLKKLENYVI